MRKLINIIKGIFNYKHNAALNKKTIETGITSFYQRRENAGCETLEGLPAPIMYGNPNASMTMLLVDDLASVFFLYELDFQTVLLKHNYDILNNFKIVRCDTSRAGFIASKYIRDHPDEIVIGILDLTLGSIIKLKDNTTLIYDGVDLAIELIELHKKCKIAICTAHMLDAENPAITELIKKFNAATGHDMLDYTFSKNSDRATYIYNLITSLTDCNDTDYSGVRKCPLK